MFFLVYLRLIEDSLFKEIYMKEFFDIRYEFDIPAVHEAIGLQLEKGKPGYICVADANILTMVHRDNSYRDVINGSIFSISDSSWVPVFVKWIYGVKYSNYCGYSIFTDIVKSGKYRMMFLGTNQQTLDAMQNNLKKINPAVADMQFIELPFCKVDEFDYEAIGEMVNEDAPDIIWVALGAPKQEIFMNRLMPHINRGVAIAVGAVFNFYSGLENNPKRCPQWMQKCNLEFLHRIFVEPKKQLTRCKNIIRNLPSILIKETKRKRWTNA